MWRLMLVCSRQIGRIMSQLRVLIGRLRFRLLEKKLLVNIAKPVKLQAN